MHVPGEGKSFISVTDLVKAGYGSRNTVLRDIELGIIPGIRVMTPGVKQSRIMIPRDELLEALESLRAAGTRDAFAAMRAEMESAGDES